MRTTALRRLILGIVIGLSLSSLTIYFLGQSPAEPFYWLIALLVLLAAVGVAGVCGRWYLKRQPAKGNIYEQKKPKTNFTKTRP